jgi:Flp pilus assembly protein TadG
MVELALVIVPLAVLLFGIVWFGVLLSFKQAVTQAAAEGARAAVPYSFTSQNSDAVTAATNAASGPLGGWSRPCGQSGVETAKGMTCTATPQPCPNGTGKCMSMTVVYDYKAHPILPNLPIISSLLPSSLSSTAVVQMNP